MSLKTEKFRAYILGLLLALICLLAAGCSSARLCQSLFPKSCDPINQPCEPVVVTEYEPHDPLPREERPAETHRQIDPAEWRAFLRALGSDHLLWKAYALGLEHTIDAFNQAQEEARENAENPSQ
jgi:hypothetical protein